MSRFPILNSTKRTSLNVHEADIFNCSRHIMPKSFSFSAGFRAVFEKGAFELYNVFEDGPPKPHCCFIQRMEVRSQPHDPLEQELRHFADCIRPKADPALLDARRAVEALELSIATQRSLRLRRAIRVASIRRS